MERRAEELKAKADSANESLNNYKGDDEATKNNLKNTYEAAKKEADDYNDYLNNCKSLTSEYFDIHLNKLPDANDEWYKLVNTIKETADAIEELNRQQKLFTYQSSIKQLEYQQDKIIDQIDMIDTLMKNAYGQDKLGLIDDKIELLKEQIESQNSIISQYKEMAKVYQGDLSRYGFKFDIVGDVTNISEVLNSFKDHEDLEKVNALLEEYIKLQRNDLPDAFKQ